MTRNKGVKIEGYEVPVGYMLVPEPRTERILLCIPKSMKEKIEAIMERDNITASLAVYNILVEALKK